MRLLPFDYAVRNLGRSRLRLALSVLGSALVVLLVIAAGGFVRGMDRALRATGDELNVLVMGIGSEESVERSEIGAATGSLLEASISGIRARSGVAYISPEVHVMLPVAAGPSGERHGHALLRGITPAATLVHSNVTLTEGRWPQPGADEVMVGRMAATTIGLREHDLAVGAQLRIDNRPWTIVGRFAAPGTVLDAEVWVPLADLMTATKRETISCVVLTLEPGEAEFADIAAFALMRPDLELSAMPEREYYDQLAAFFGPIRAVAWITAALIAVGGLFGGLNTMYAAFASRARELGTLQSLGFRRGAIIASLVQESSLATAAGALAACAAGTLLLDGVGVRFSAGAFALVVDTTIVLIGLASGIALGLVGALPPAWRCLRMPIPIALKSM
ncbi:MAG: ABC transporter permease [Phycisphaeraceae bacterium]|nr:ABC transporter permease [Phycisphaeraceae bacterium]